MSIFLLCRSDTLEPVLVVELDDASHDRPDRRERDGFVDELFASVELPILHLRARKSYEPHEIRRQIEEALRIGEPVLAVPSQKA